jgi:L-threonylcarbamoyladenylate synthase
VSDTGKIWPPKQEAIEAAARALSEGLLVGFPTETVYGLGADARDDAAVAKVFEAKQRPKINPLIVHVRTLECAQEHVQLSAAAIKVAEAFWPGPLTIVANRKSECSISLLASAGLDTLAVRAPRNKIAQSLLTAFDGPVAAPSANPSGTVSATTAIHVAAGLSAEVAYILDGGPSEVGIESTVLSMVDDIPSILRSGAVARADLEKILGKISDAPHPSGAIRSPGQLASHYAPILPVRLNATSADKTEALLAFGPKPIEGAASTLNLSVSGDLSEAAANLFAHLRALDRAQYNGIAVMPIPNRGIGDAINDRLSRAAAPRPI